MKQDVVIIGAGLAGLCCALSLRERGIHPLLLEASDDVGGRIRTDDLEGFKLDRGFQVFLDSYPEAQQRLDYPALELKRFLPGALIHFNGRMSMLMDPWRTPAAALGTLLNPIGSLGDKLRMNGLRNRAIRGSVTDHFKDPEHTTLYALQRRGFSPTMIDRFFRPFFGGIFLESELNTSSRMFYFLFRMFSLGSACLPAAGMAAIPRQLASRLPADNLRLNARVQSLHAGLVRLADGEEIRARAIVVATDAPASAALLGNEIVAAGQGVTCVYFSTPTSPVPKPLLVLNGDGTGPINNLAVVSDVAPAYAPKGKSLVSVTVLGTTRKDPALVEEIRAQLKSWFGTSAGDWRHLRTYRIPYALPRQAAPTLEVPERPVRWGPGVYVCGDHRDQGSINGAMTSGRRAAEAILKDVSS